MLYHLPDGRWYEATVAEVWFDNEESAVAAGFTKAGARKAAADESSETDEPSGITAPSEITEEDEA